MAHNDPSVQPHSALQYEPGKMFVGGLSWETTPDSMKTYFQKFGNVTDCVVMTDNETQKPRGFGFVTFENDSSVNDVLQTHTHSLDGKMIDPKRATTKGGDKSNQVRKLFLGGLSFDTSEEGIKKVFQDEGHMVTGVEIKKDDEGKRRGFAFVDFSTPEDADKACLKRYIQIDNKRVEVKKAEPKGNRDKKRMNPQGTGVFGNGPSFDQHQMSFHYSGGNDMTRFGGMSNTQYNTGGSTAAHYSHYPQYNSAYPDYSSGYSQPGNSATVFQNYTGGGYQSGYRGQQQMTSYSQDSSTYGQSRNGFPSTGGGTNAYTGFEQQSYSNYGDQHTAGNPSSYSTGTRTTSGTGGGQGGRAGGTSSGYTTYTNH